MEQSAKKIDNTTVQWATDMAIHYSKERIESSLRFMADKEKKERVAKGECAFCFYMRNERIGGAAMTSRPCGVCGKDQMYGSTNTDEICLDCSKEHQLCKYCGGDIHMRARRKFEK